MNGIEIALIILVLIWSSIFLIIAISLLIIFRQIKKGVDTINEILDNTRDITVNIANPLSKAITGATFLKEAIGSVINIKRVRNYKNKNRK